MTEAEFNHALMELGLSPDSWRVREAERAVHSLAIAGQMQPSEARQCVANAITQFGLN